MAWRVPSPALGTECVSWGLGVPKEDSVRSGVQAEGGRGTLGIACSAGTASAPVAVLSRVVTGWQALSGKSVGMGKSPGVLSGRSRAPCCGRIALQAPGRAEPERVGQAAWPRVSDWHHRLCPGAGSSGAGSAWISSSTSALSRFLSVFEASCM